MTITMQKLLASRSVLTLVAGLGVALLGCTTEEAVDSTASDVENSCKLGDSSHTLDPAVTCIKKVSSSNNDKAALVASAPYDDGNGHWVTSCNLSGITCAGTSEKRDLSCPSPEYPATGQDIACSPTWTSNLIGFLGVVVLGDYFKYQPPSATAALNACKAQYGNLLLDLNATANNMCNAAAAGWTNDSKKSAVCCIPGKVPVPIPTPTQAPAM